MDDSRSDDAKWWAATALAAGEAAIPLVETDKGNPITSPNSALCRYLNVHYACTVKNSTVRDWIGKKRQIPTPEFRSDVLHAIDVLLDDHETSTRLRAILDRRPHGAEGAASRRASGVASRQAGFAKIDLRSRHRQHLEAHCTWIGDGSTLKGALPRFGLESAMTSNAVPAHVTRHTVDQELDKAFGRAFVVPDHTGGVNIWDRLVVAVGPRCAGKTHAVLHSLNRAIPAAATVLSPLRTPESFQTVADAVMSGTTGIKSDWYVIVADDFGATLTDPSRAPDLTTLLGATSHQVVLAVTLWPSDLPTSNDTIRRMFADRHELLDLLRGKRINVPDVWDEDDLDRARQRHPNLDTQSDRPGADFRSERALIAAFETHLQSEQKETVAMCQALADQIWVNRSGVEAAILAKLYTNRWRKLNAGLTDAVGYERTAAHLTSEVEGTNDRILLGGADGWVLNDTLFNFVNQQIKAPDPGAISDLDAADCSAVGIALLISNRLRESVPWLEKGASGGDGEAMTRLGSVLSQQGDPAGALKLWRSARKIPGTHVAEAIRALADHHLLNEETDKAVALFTEAANAGDPISMIRVCRITASRGDLEQSDMWAMKAASLGRKSAMSHLAQRERSKGNVDECHRLWTSAAELGDPSSCNNLAVLERDLGNVQVARNLFEKAISLSSMTAAYNLARLEHDRCRHLDAHRWLEIGIARGNQACLEAQITWKHECDVDCDPMPSGLTAMESYWQRKADGGSAYALARLGGLLRASGKPQRGLELIQLAARKGDRSAASTVALHFQYEGQMSEARELFRQSWNLGYTTAGTNLAALERSLGNTAAAISIYEQLKSDGWVAAAHFIGSIERDRGNFNRAVEMFEEAVAAGYQPAVAVLRDLRSGTPAD